MPRSNAGNTAMLFVMQVSYGCYCWWSTFDYVSVVEKSQIAFCLFCRCLYNHRRRSCCCSWLYSCWGSSSVWSHFQPTDVASSLFSFMPSALLPPVESSSRSLLCSVDYGSSGGPCDWCGAITAPPRHRRMLQVPSKQRYTWQCPTSTRLLTDRSPASCFQAGKGTHRTRLSAIAWSDCGHRGVAVLPWAHPV